MCVVDVFSEIISRAWRKEDVFFPVVSLFLKNKLTWISFVACESFWIFHEQQQSGVMASCSG